MNTKALKALCISLQQQGVRALPYGQCFLSIYDYDEFENFDYDIIDGPTRQKISKELTILGAMQHTARRLSYNYEGCTIEIHFPKPSFSLGANPGDSVLELLRTRTKDDSRDVIIITPTQALLVALATNTLNLEEAQNLVFHHPANLPKVMQLYNQQPTGSFAQKDYEALLDRQNEGVQLRKQKALGKFPLLSK